MTREIPILTRALAEIMADEDIEFPGGGLIVRRWHPPTFLSEQAVKDLCEIFRAYSLAMEPASLCDIETALEGLAQHYIAPHRTLHQFKAILPDYQIPLFGFCPTALALGIQNWREAETDFPKIPELVSAVRDRQDHFDREFCRLELLQMLVASYGPKIPAIRDENGERMALDDSEVEQLVTGNVEGEIHWPAVNGVVH